MHQAPLAAFNHADRSVHPERDVAERGAWQLILPAPLLVGDQTQAPAGGVVHLGAAAVELRVGEGDRAERVTTLEAQEPLTALLLLLL